MLINTPLQVLTAAPALHSLIVRDREDVADILKFLNHIHGDLRKLSIENIDVMSNVLCTSMKEVNTDFLANIVALFPDLEVLSLQSTSRLNSDDYCLIAQLKELSELNLSIYQVDYMCVQPYI